MASKESLREDIRKYEALKRQMNTLADRLYTANNDAVQISKTLDRNYTLNNNSVAAVGSISRLSEDILEERDIILDEVIPAIDDAIEDCEDEIRRIEEEEEEDD
jgi:ribosomal 50S subunit-associated protein YjgA (DUF615 family)